MNTRATARKQIPSTWRSAEADDIDQALSYLGVFYTENSRHEESHPFRNGCMDWNRNQTGGCSCVADLLVWKNGHEHNKWSDYALVCQEISDWFRSTGDLESRLAKLNKLGTKEFKESFARCIVLKKCTTGIFTKMVDLSVTPGIGVQSYNERTGLLIRHNAVVTTSTLCLNSARNLWIVLTGSEFGGNQSNPIFIDWKEKNYGAILHWCAQVQEDVTTQKKQELFYARMEDFMAAPEDMTKIPYKRAMEHYNQKYGTINNDRESQKWRETAKKQWNSRWNLKSIHILKSGTKWNFNPTTKSLVNNLDLRVGRVSTESVNTLLELAKAMEGDRDSWRVVRQDKKLLYFPMPESTSVTSAINTAFVATGKRGSIGSKIKESKFMDRVRKVDKELEELLLRLLNTQGTEPKVQEVAFQFTVLMAKTHEVQHPHWDYTNESGGKNNFLVAFLPLTSTGQFLQIWEHETGSSNQTEGNICFIPGGEFLLAPGTVLHGGGFRAESGGEVEHAHIRAHFYIYPRTKDCMVSVHNNEYTDANGAHLEEICVNNHSLSGTLEHDGEGNECLEWTFFEGKRPFDRRTGEEIKRKQTRSTKK